MVAKDLFCRSKERDADAKERIEVNSTGRDKKKERARSHKVLVRAVRGCVSAISHAERYLGLHASTSAVNCP
jgi:hypothetical protein